MSKYVVLDLETTGSQTYKRFCNPLDLTHSITMIGYKQQGSPARGILNNVDFKQGIPRGRVFSSITAQTNIDWSQVNFLVGQNVKFDLMWFWQDENFQAWLRAGGQVWDTQTVQYLLDAQDKRIPRHLNNLAVKYGGFLKDDRVGMMFKAGKKANEIPKDILFSYGLADVDNTEIVLLGQAKAVMKVGNQALIRVYMKHYLALCEMEYNGIFIDKPLLEQKAKEIGEKIADYIVVLQKSIHKDLLWPHEHVEFNPGSLQHVSAVVFGGLIKYVADMPSLNEDGEQVIYKVGAKKGQVKTKKTKMVYDYKGLGCSVTGFNVDAKGYYGTDESVLQSIIEKEGDKTGILAQILKYRTDKKLLGTYYHSVTIKRVKDKETGKMVERKKETGFIPLIHPHSGCIHTEFKTCNTETGRTASGNPNVQNMPPVLLDVMCSRYGDAGVIVEIDWSQIEVITQALLSQCPNFIRDLEAGVDFHCKRLAYTVPESYEEVVKLCASDPAWKDLRKGIKPLSFAKAFGARPQKIADDNGLDLKLVEMIFDLEDKEYPEIETYYQTVRDEIAARSVIHNDLISIRNKATGETLTMEGEQTASGYYTDPTGKTYCFQQHAVLTKNGNVWRWYKDTEVKDFPVQGIAATIFCMMGGELFDFAIQHRDKFLMINEIHDSYILDVKLVHLDFTLKQVQAILERVQEVFKATFGIELNVPLKFDICYGKTWKAAKDGE